MSTFVDIFCFWPIIILRYLATFAETKEWRPATLGTYLFQFFRDQDHRWEPEPSKGSLGGTPKSTLSIRGVSEKSSLGWT
jgi:hypothetical protein